MLVITPEVRELVRRRVTTMDHVEVLMRLHETDGKPLTEAEVRTASRLEPAVVARALADLVTTGLVRHDPASANYAFDPKSAEDRRTVDALSVLYHQRPVTLVKLVYEQPPAPVKSFADAFRLRDEKKEP